MKANYLIAIPAFLLCLGTACFTYADTIQDCKEMVKGGILPIASDRSKRFMGKVEQATAKCRGGEKPQLYRDTPWVDWANYWAAGDADSQKDGAEAITKLGEHLKPNGRGIDGSLMDLEYQRIELIKFNLFDNYTYEDYIKGLDGRPGDTVKQWDEMRLSPQHPDFNLVGGDGPQLCQGQLIRHRTLTGICNDLINPKMGSTGTYFSRNAQFEETFPRLAKNDLVKARHSDPENGLRIGLLKPDPQLISRKLFTREQSEGSSNCNTGYGSGDLATADQCDYLPAPFFNVLAAFWIQFMTHDWFAHLDEGRNQPGLKQVGCQSAEAKALGCRPGDRMEAALIADDSEPGTFSHNGVEYLKRSPKVTSNNVTAWWDASQIYGYDTISESRAIRDPDDNAKLLQKNGFLPVFENCDSSAVDCAVQPQWQGQEATAFADNWSIGLSFYHNLFVREHNYFVEQFRELQQSQPDEDSGLRHPDQPQQVIAYKDVSDDEIYQAARLVVSAQIAKIHTIEWTTQLLYDEPLFRGMNSNWFGLFNLEEEGRVSRVLRKILGEDENFLSRLSDRVSLLFGGSRDSKKSSSLYSIAASGAGIFGLGNKREKGKLWWRHDAWDVSNPEHVNGGINHFGSPFNFPEEFPTVYRLHTMVPDLIDYREWQQANEIKQKVPVIDTVRGKATEHMQSRGLENWALSMGRQRLGLLHLKNHPLFLQNLDMTHLQSPSGKLDIAALDIIRDRERGVTRFNEFRRQIGLKTLTSFDDFIDQRNPEGSTQRSHQQQVISQIREIYGTHTCDASKIISVVQRDENGNFINDCLGHADGSSVDNIEDVDMVVGWLAEYTRPHGFAISETQFHIFIINASRRLFSDRFFTSSFRPEFYSQLGYDWVLDNGPLSECPYSLSEGIDGNEGCYEPELSNGHQLQVSPLKRLLLRNTPELKDELMHVVNAFDPWARDRGEYYTLKWEPRADAAADEAFAE